jgi:putative membrane protein
LGLKEVAPRTEWPYEKDCYANYYDLVIVKVFSHVHFFKMLSESTIVAIGSVSKMFVDYLAVMLLNLGAGLALLAHYLYVNPEKDSRRSWAAGFFAVGFLGLVSSLPMMIMWPLPSSFNVAYAGPMLYLSMVFLAGGLTLMLEWEPVIPAIYGFFGGIYAIVIGIRLLDLKLGAEPAVAFLGFVLTGIGGMLFLPAIYWRKNRLLTIVTAIILGLAAIIWLFTAYDAVWAHILDFIKYLPPTMLHGKKQPFGSPGLCWAQRSCNCEGFSE